MAYFRLFLLRQEKNAKVMHSVIKKIKPLHIVVMNFNQFWQKFTKL